MTTHDITSPDALVASAEAHRRRILSGDVRWNRWSYDPKRLRLQHEGLGVSIDLGAILGPHDVLREVVRAQKEPGMPRGDVGDLVEALSDLFGGHVEPRSAVAFEGWRVLRGKAPR